MRNSPPLDPIERRVLQGVSKLWSTDEAAWLASCSVTLIRKAVRDGHLEGLRHLAHLPNLLPLGGERRGEEPASQTAQECAPAHYWITSSARWSKDWGSSAQAPSPS
jgi:hypothetical protein